MTSQYNKLHNLGAVINGDGFPPLATIVWAGLLNNFKVRRIFTSFCMVGSLY